MGNRCVITDKARNLGVYLHWNGGIGSVEAFLTYCDLKGARGFGEDTSYAMARLVQVVGNFFGGSLSIGVSAYSTDEAMDPGDNGIYVVEGWKISEHLISTEITDTDGNVSYKMMPTDISKEKREYDLKEMLKAIDEKQPAGEQLGAYLDAEMIKAKDLKIGDIYYTRDFSENIVTATCCGFGNGTVNGTDRTGIPFGVTESWLKYGEFDSITLEAITKASKNPNCYVMTAMVAVPKKEGAE